LNYNPSSTTSQSSFHGTGISLFQFPTKDNPGTKRPHKPLPDSMDRKHNLPDCYEIIPAIALKANDIVVPKISYEVEKERSHLDVAITKQKS